MLVRILFLVLAISAAIAHGYRFRQKRVSDQRLAELETLVALSEMNGKIKTIPYGFGSVDPRKIGRKRRSSSASSSTSPVLLNRLLESVARQRQVEEEDAGGEAMKERGVDETRTDTVSRQSHLQWPSYFWSSDTLDE